MQKIGLIFFLFFVNFGFTQQSDFKHIDFRKADYIAKNLKTKRIYELNKLTFKLTNNLDTDVEKLRAIYIWICNNIANDFRLYSLNKRKRKRFAEDSIKLQNWNSKFKKTLFKKLLKKKRTICTGYAYLLKEMCKIVGIESKMVNGFGRTSTVDFTKLNMPNHTWNVVKLNNKWYLCDPTWSTGISFPEEGRFQFIYNDGYFLTDPNLFILNHYPIENRFSLLEDKTPSLKNYTELPLLYGDAFTVLEKHLSPKKMHHIIKQNDSFNFTYQLKKEIDLNKIKFIVDMGSTEKSTKPKVDLQNNILTLNHTFKKRGFFDLHLYIENKLIATYTFKVEK
ncbi:MAG: transglutaminase domain-containing protein [Polaribacter sp.]